MWIPALPGLASWGHTREEALRNIQDAAEAYAEDMIEAGESIPLEAEKVRVIERAVWQSRYDRGGGCPRQLGGRTTISDAASKIPVVGLCRAPRRHDPVMPTLKPDERGHLARPAIKRTWKPWSPSFPSEGDPVRSTGPDHAAGL